MARPPKQDALNPKSALYVKIVHVTTPKVLAGRVSNTMQSVQAEKEDYMNK